MDTSFIHSIWTVLVFICFIGIVLWAYSSRRKGDFDEASRLPLEDEPDNEPQKKESEE